MTSTTASAPTGGPATAWWCRRALSTSISTPEPSGRRACWSSSPSRSTTSPGLTSRSSWRRRPRTRCPDGRTSIPTSGSGRGERQGGRAPRRGDRQGLPRHRRRGPGRRRDQLHHRGGSLLHPAGAVGLRQDHHPALRRRPGAHRRRQDLAGGTGRLQPQAARVRPARRARSRDGLPELRHLAAHDRVRQRRLPAACHGKAPARDPKLLLLDEPLSNLDAGLRERMRTELRRLQRTVGVTTLYVTHDQSEALSMSNRVAVMEGGRIVQEASPRDIYRRPATRFVANFVGRTNLLDARVLGGGDGGTLRLETRAGVLHAVCPEGTRQYEAASLSIRPEDVRLHVERPVSSVPNVLEGRVEYRLFLGESVEYQVSVGGELLLSRQHPDVDLRRRTEVFVEFPVQHCIVVSDERGSTAPPPAGLDEDSQDGEPEGLQDARPVLGAVPPLPVLAGEVPARIDEPR